MYAIGELTSLHRGCVVLSRLSMLYPDRFHGFVWLALSFMEPATSPFDLDGVMTLMKQVLGYEGYSYWKFFEKEGAADIIEKNVSIFYGRFFSSPDYLPDRQLPPTTISQGS